MALMIVRDLSTAIPMRPLCSTLRTFGSTGRRSCLDIACPPNIFRQVNRAMT
jgi:hypothetical protein